MKIKTNHPYPIRQVNNYKRVKDYFSFLNFRAEKTYIPKTWLHQRNLVHSEILIINLIVSYFFQCFNDLFQLPRNQIFHCKINK
jgi:hypothetical protein